MAHWLMFALGVVLAGVVLMFAAIGALGVWSAWDDARRARRERR